MDLRTNSDYFPIQQKVTGFYNDTESVYCAVRNKCLYSLHLQSNPVITHRFMRHPVYSVRYSAVPINPSLLPTTLYSSVIKALVYNDRKHSVPFMALYESSVYVFCVDLRTNSDYFPIEH
jgi:hypothetical protein